MSLYYKYPPCGGHKETGHASHLGIELKLALHTTEHGRQFTQHECAVELTPSTYTVISQDARPSRCCRRRHVDTLHHTLHTDSTHHVRRIMISISSKDSA